MKILTTTVARIIFALPFGIFGVMHLMMAGKMAGMVPSFIPGGVFWIYLTGLALVAACVSIIIQKMAKLSCLLLALMLLLFIMTMHVPGLMNEMTMQMSMSALLKDMALMG
ncbi:MAG: DoxX family protein, partial [Bacteroidetes bacterium]|nr:DoxX family protein [Bacteroidota bacterium]